MGRCLFIRDDDIWTLDKNFRFFFDSAMDRGLPVVYAVIPGKMDKGLIQFLGHAKERTPQLLDIVQHGWVHANHSVSSGTKYEFGGSRSLKSQREDIKQGLKQMRLAFGEHFTPAFVPPYHGYDERTLRVLEEEGFWGFSARSRRLEKKSQLVKLPARISFTRYDADGSRGVNTAADMMKMVAKGIYRQSLSGVVMHHADFKAAASRQELTRFFDWVAALRDKKGWRVLLFSDLWRK